MFLSGQTAFRQTSSGITQIIGELQTSRYEPAGGTLTGTGLLDADANFASMRVAPGNSPGVLTVEGDANFEASSVLEIEVGNPVQGAPNPTPYDLLVVDGDVSLGGVLEVRLLEGASNYLNLEQPFFIVSTHRLASPAAFIDPETGEFVFLPSFTGSPRGSITGTFSNLDADGRVLTADGTGSFLVTIESSTVTLSDFQAIAPDIMGLNEALSDHDGDGTIFAKEWIFGSDPDRFDAIKPLVAQTTISGADLLAFDPELELLGEEVFRAFSFRMRKDRRGVLIVPQASESLKFGDDPSVRAIHAGTAQDGEFEIVTYALVRASGDTAPSKAFIRIALDLSNLPIPPIPPGPPIVLPPIITPPTLPPVVIPPSPDPN